MRIEEMEKNRFGRLNCFSARFRMTELHLAPWSSALFENWAIFLLSSGDFFTTEFLREYKL